jgi:hypothetical protein
VYLHPTLERLLEKCASNAKNTLVHHKHTFQHNEKYTIKNDSTLWTHADCHHPHHQSQHRNGVGQNLYFCNQGGRGWNGDMRMVSSMTLLSDIVLAQYFHQFSLLLLLYCKNNGNHHHGKRYRHPNQHSYWREEPRKKTHLAADRVWRHAKDETGQAVKSPIQSMPISIHEMMTTIVGRNAVSCGKKLFADQSPNLGSPHQEV